MHDRQYAQPLNLLVCAQNVHVGLRGRHAAARRRHEVDIGFMRSGGWIEWLGLLSLVRGSSAAVRMMHLRTIANVVLPILVRAYERSEQTQEIKYNSVTRAGAYVRSGPPCDSRCGPQCPCACGIVKCTVKGVA